MSIEWTTLKNGLRVVTDSIPHVETVSMGVWLDIGTRNETAPVNGIAHVLEHMAFKGTQRRTALQIAAEIESVGGYLNAYTARESTAYYVRALKGDTALATDLLGDILQNSLFDEQEFSREQSVILQEIGQARDTPDDIIFDHFQEACYPNQPMGWPTLGREEVIRSLTPEAVQNYMRQHYGAQRMVFAAAGHVDHHDFIELVLESFSSLSPGEKVPPQKALYQGGHYREEKDLEQVHLVLGFEGVPYKHPDYYQMAVLSTLLGGGMSSRLFQEIREKRGLVYSVSSSANSYQDSGLFTIYSGTGEKEVQELFPVLCDELRQLPKTITEEEIRRAKTQIKASILMGLESTSNRCERLAHQMLVYGRPLSISEIIQGIDVVTIENLKAFAEKIFHSSPTLASLGPVQHVWSLGQLWDRLR